MKLHRRWQLPLWRAVAASALLLFPTLTGAAPSHDSLQVAARAVEYTGMLFGAPSGISHTMLTSAQGDPRRYTFPSSPKANEKAVVTGGEGSQYRFTVLTDRLFRYEWSPDGQFEDRASTFALFRNLDAPQFRVIDKPDNLEIITDHFHLQYNKKEFGPDGFVVKVGTDSWRYDGQSYGDLNGTARTLDTAAGRIPLAPGVLSKKGYAVLDDSKSMLFTEDGFIAPRVEGRTDGYVFAYQRDHKAAIKDFYKISGPQPILPRWTLSNWWSRYWAYSEKTYLELMDHFKAEEIPLSAGVIDMDWHLVKIPEKYGSGWTGYTWNKTLFPDPEGFLKQLHNRGLKATLNDHPADGIRSFEDLYEPVAKAMDMDPSRGDPVEFDCTDRKFLDVYFDVLKLNLEKQGVDFWWIDWQQGNHSKIPGIDPLWPLNHFHYLASQRQLDRIERPITFSRYAGPGSHRYPIGFSGDTKITWGSLNFQPEFTATASNIGFGWWSHDIGGHFQGTRSNDLTARWVQLGCFSPILRLHSEKSEWNSKEPWLYEPATYAVMKKFMQLRHRLIPFLFTQNVRASLEGEPLVQPMYWHHPHNESAYQVPNQYYFGPDLIVAPITSPLSTVTLTGFVKAWLPAGRYVDFTHPSLVYDGGRFVNISRLLSEIPVLAKEGTIMPVDATPHLENSVANPGYLNIQLVVGADGNYTLIEEDETVPPEVRFKNNTFVHTPIIWEQATGKLTIGPESGAANPSQRNTATRNYLVTLVGFTNVDLSPSLAPPMSVVSTANHSTRLDLGNVSVSQGATVTLGKDLQLDVVDMPARLHEMLYRCQTDYLNKTWVWNKVVNDPEPVHARIQDLYDEEVGEDLTKAVMEIWFADERSFKGGKGGRELEGVEPRAYGDDLGLNLTASPLNLTRRSSGSTLSSTSDWEFVGEGMED